MKQTKKLFAILLVGVSVLAVGCGTTTKSSDQPAASSPAVTDTAATTAAN